MRLEGSTVRDIAASVERAIVVGEFGPGDQLPTVRELAARLGVSPATVAAAYSRLRDRAFIVTDTRRGTRVSGRPALGSRPPAELPAGVVDLASGNPDPGLLPSLQDSLRELEVPSRMYGEPAALPGFLEALGAGPHAVVVSGGLDGIERLLQAHLRRGDAVAVEDPGYVGLLDLVRSMGLAVVPMAIDERGPLPEAAERSMTAGGASALILTPRAQNPTGAALDDARAAELRDVLARHPDVLLIEDDHMGSVSAGESFTTIDRARRSWALVRSLNKSLGPDLRLGAAEGDALTIGRVQGRQAVGAGWVSHIVQAVGLHLLRDRATQTLLERATVAYRERRELLLDALARHSIAAQGGTGFNVWIPVPEEDAVVRGLLARGWAVRAGEPYRLQSPPAIRVTTATMTADDARGFAADLTAVLRPVERPRLG
jgi:DNA-binding transcriptional MocR family regulator